MTDNEIIKAIECCLSMSLKHYPCEDCPLKSEPCFSERTLIKQALDLINRQNAEIERLCVELDEVIIAKDLLFDEAEALIKKAKAEAVKEFAERLKEKFACLEYVIQTNRKTLPIERVKAEVDTVLQNGCSNVVDKILKETVGEG